MKGRTTPQSTSARAGVVSLGDTQIPLPQRAGVEHRFIDLPGLRMHVAEAGAGEPVLLLHGFPLNWWEWRDVIGSLAPHYRVICPDMRGAGWTDAPADGYNRKTLTADIRHLIDALGYSQVRIVGDDWGSLIGFLFSLTYPTRVKSFVWIGAMHPYVPMSPRVMAPMWRLWFQFVIAAPGVGPALLGRGKQRLTRYLLRSNRADPHQYSSRDAEIYVTLLRKRARAQAASALYRGFILPAVVDLARGTYRKTRLHPPTLVLGGMQDPFNRADTTARYPEYADDMSIAMVNHASHYVVEEQSAEVGRLVREFFARS